MKKSYIIYLNSRQNNISISRKWKNSHLRQDQRSIGELWLDTIKKKVELKGSNDL